MNIETRWHTIDWSTHNILHASSASATRTCIIGLTRVHFHNNQASNGLVQKYKFDEPLCYEPAPEEKYESFVYESVDAEEFSRDLRRLQHKNKFTDKTCLDFISLFSQYVDGHVPAGFTECDKKLNEAAGIEVIELHGCSKCDGHVYGPEDKRTHCPCCGAARYCDETGKPIEVCM